MLIDKQDLPRNASGSEEILRRPQIRALTGLSDASIYRLAKEGRFPQPVAISTRAVGWRRSEVDGWLSNLSPKKKEAA